MRWGLLVAALGLVVPGLALAQTVPPAVGGADKRLVLPVCAVGELLYWRGNAGWACDASEYNAVRADFGGRLAAVQAAADAITVPPLPALQGSVPAGCTGPACTFTPPPAVVSVPVPPTVPPPVVPPVTPPLVAASCTVSVVLAVSAPLCTETDGCTGGTPTTGTISVPDGQAFTSISPSILVCTQFEAGTCTAVVHALDGYQCTNGAVTSAGTLGHDECVLGTPTGPQRYSRGARVGGRECLGGAVWL